MLVTNIPSLVIKPVILMTFSHAIYDLMCGSLIYAREKEKFIWRLTGKIFFLYNIKETTWYKMIIQWYRQIFILYFVLILKSWLVHLGVIIYRKSKSTEKISKEVKKTLYNETLQVKLISFSPRKKKKKNTMHLIHRI